MHALIAFAAVSGTTGLEDLHSGNAGLVIDWLPEAPVPVGGGVVGAGGGESADAAGALAETNGWPCCCGAAVAIGCSDSGSCGAGCCAAGDTLGAAAAAAGDVPGTGAGADAATAGVAVAAAAAGPAAVDPTIAAGKGAGLGAPVASRKARRSCAKRAWQASGDRRRPCFRRRKVASVLFQSSSPHHQPAKAAT